ncbi:MAG: hypothetical protein P1U63_11750 [Coxiellaceae bacterium]|nr:hypothetical protein [Coxiellaceae bacterium]
MRPTSVVVYRGVSQILPAVVRAAKKPAVLSLMAALPPRAMATAAVAPASRRVAEDLAMQGAFVTAEANLSLPPAQEVLSVAQGVRGATQLMVGDFAYFTKEISGVIAETLKSRQLLILLFDRDGIAVPANERALWILNHFNHVDNLQVKVVYGAPEVESLDAYCGYLYGQIPTTVDVRELCSFSEADEALAEILSVPTRSYDLRYSDEMIKEDVSEYTDALVPHTVQRVLNPFDVVIPSEAFESGVDDLSKLTYEKMQAYNQGAVNIDRLFMRTPWDLSALQQVNLPMLIGPPPVEFSGLDFSCPAITQVFDMPFYLPGQGFKLPRELYPVMPILMQCVAAEREANPEIADYHAYVTVDCGVVAPQGFARRDGLHVDGFLASSNIDNNQGILWGDHTYVFSNQQPLQTELYPGPFDLSDTDYDDPQGVLATLAEQGKGMAYYHGLANHLYRMDTNTVHAVHPNLSGQYLLRTFLKVTFSPRKFNRSGNTVNPLFEYDLLYVPRGRGRNTQNFTGTVPSNSRAVSLKELDNGDEGKYLTWLSHRVLSCEKRPEVLVRAQPATVGERLKTVVDGCLVTENIARSSDMVVTREGGDHYLLSATKFRRLYRESGTPGLFKPTARELMSRRVTEDVSFVASWGTRQQIPAGGYILEDDVGERWGVHEESFNATYQKI